MDADKLNEAANNIPTHAPDALYDMGYVCGFMDCANWLMQQPLADRLTDEEKEKITEIYWQAMKDWVGIGEARGHCKVGVAIEQIFGEELFNEK